MWISSGQLARRRVGIHQPVPGFISMRVEQLKKRCLGITARPAKPPSIGRSRLDSGSNLRKVRLGDLNERGVVSVEVPDFVRFDHPKRSRSARSRSRTYARSSPACPLSSDFGQRIQIQLQSPPVLHAV